MIWLVPIVVLLITLYCARQAVYAQTHRSYTASKSQISANFESKIDPKNDLKIESQHDLKSDFQVGPKNKSETDSTKLQQDHTADPQTKNQSAQSTSNPHSQIHLAKNDVKPHEAPSLLYANHAAATAESDHSEDDNGDEVSDIGDITMDVSEMLKELNLRETDSPRLDIDTNEYSQLKTGQPGDVEPEKIVVVADKLRKMLH